MVNKVKLGINNLYLFKNNNDDYLLLDTGLACKEDLILNKINKVIGDYNKIKVIVITHSHSDHIGNLKLLLDKIKRADKIVIIHSNAKEIILSGEKIIPNGFYKFTKYISKKLKLKISKEFQKGFKNLSEEDLKHVVFLDFKDYEEFYLRLNLPYKLNLYQAISNHHYCFQININCLILILLYLPYFPLYAIIIS